MASVHQIDAKRARHMPRLPRVSAPPGPPQEIDRAAALSMLGTFDVEDAELPTADDVLASLARSPMPSDPISTPPHAPIGDPGPVPAAGADAQLNEDVESDEILRELEEHHRRSQPSARPATLRGSAELRPARPRTSARRRQRNHETTDRGPQRRHRRPKPTAIFAAVVLITAASGITAIEQIEGTHKRSAGDGRSPTAIAAAAIAAETSPSVLTTLTNVFIADARALAQHVKPALARYERKPVVHARPSRHRAARRAVVIAPAQASSSTTQTPSETPSSAATSGSSTGYNTQPAVTATRATTHAATTSSPSAPQAAGPLTPGSVGANCNPQCK